MSRKKQLETLQMMALILMTLENREADSTKTHVMFTTRRLQIKFLSWHLQQTVGVTE